MAPGAENLRIGQSQLLKSLNLVGRSGYVQNGKRKTLGCHFDAYDERYLTQNLDSNC